MDISKRLLKKDELHIIREVADIVWPATFSSILSPEQISYMMEMMYSPAVMEEEFDRGVIFHAVFNNGFVARLRAHKGFCEENAEKPAFARLFSIVMFIPTRWCR